jgi:hypothetical protein
LAEPSIPEPKHIHKPPLLNLQPLGDRKLERAFKALVGTTRPQDTRRGEFKAALRELGFFWKDGRVTHPGLTGRSAALPEKVDGDPMVVALAFISRYFPETDFYLPFIVAKAKLQNRLKAGGKLEPEPEYDEDGFLEG